MDKIHIFDTTLRDGEQSPGFSMNREEKLRLARQIEELGADVIPIAVDPDGTATPANSTARTASERNQAQACF